jgi:hypothetical protein
LSQCVRVAGAAFAHFLDADEPNLPAIARLVNVASWVFTRDFIRGVSLADPAERCLARFAQFLLSAPDDRARVCLSQCNWNACAMLALNSFDEYTEVFEDVTMGLVLTLDCFIDGNSRAAVADERPLATVTRMVRHLIYLLLGGFKSEAFMAAFQELRNADIIGPETM